MSNEYKGKNDYLRNAVVTLWVEMAKLFHPQWAKNNGEIDGPVFQDWLAELQHFGSKGVLRGIKAVKASRTSYAPNLNKFIGFCLESKTHSIRPGDSYSEQINGGKLKPTPNGVPLCWTIPPMEPYTADELRASGLAEDAIAADKLEGTDLWQ